jgi:hypothetical protein
LGHIKIQTTIDIYGHWVPGEGERDKLHGQNGQQAPGLNGPVLTKTLTK